MEAQDLGSCNAFGRIVVPGKVKNEHGREGQRTPAVAAARFLREPASVHMEISDILRLGRRRSVQGLVAVVRRASDSRQQRRRQHPSHLVPWR